MEKKMSEKEMIEMIEKMKKENELLLSKINSKGGRKGEVLNLIKGKKGILVKEIAEAIGIESKNVSTLMNYLKKYGWSWGKNSKGGLVLEESCWNYEKKEDKRSDDFKKLGEC